jgi:hypothetical protein
VLLVGRHANADIRFQHLTVSKRHAELRVAAARVWARDAGSCPGAFVNCRPLRGDVWHTFWPGDVLKTSIIHMRLIATASLAERSRRRDGEAVTLSRQIREQGEYAKFPALADALLGERCVDADLLALCRQPEAWAHNDWLLNAILGEKSSAYPDFYESWSELDVAGWYVWEEEVAGPPHAPVWRVTGRHNDCGDLNASGSTQAEAWYRAVEQAQSLRMVGRSIAQERQSK